MQHETVDPRLLDHLICPLHRQRLALDVPRMLPPHYRLVVSASEALRRAAQRVPAVQQVADSLYLESRRR